MIDASHDLNISEQAKASGDGVFRESENGCEIAGIALDLDDGLPRTAPGCERLEYEP